MNDYQRGTKDAWELARKICSCQDDCYTIKELIGIFGHFDVIDIMVQTYDEAKEKIEKWKKEQYKVGDIIEFQKEKAYVTKVDGYVVHYLKANGESGGFVIDKHDATWKVRGHIRSLLYDEENGRWT